MAIRNGCCSISILHVGTRRRRSLATVFYAINVRKHLLSQRPGHLKKRASLGFLYITEGCPSRKIHLAVLLCLLAVVHIMEWKGTPFMPQITQIRIAIVVLIVVCLAPMLGLMIVSASGG